jgi:hypothetical protein
MYSSSGILLDRALHLDFASDKFQVDWADVPADEFNVLRLLKAEQNKHEREQAEKNKNGARTAANRN